MSVPAVAVSAPRRGELSVEQGLLVLAEVGLFAVADFPVDLALLGDVSGVGELLQQRLAVCDRACSAQHHSTAPDHGLVVVDVGLSAGGGR